MEEKERLSESEEKAKHKLPQGRRRMHGSLIKGQNKVLVLKNEIIAGRFQFGARSCYLTAACSS